MSSVFIAHAALLAAVWPVVLSAQVPTSTPAAESRSGASVSISVLDPSGAVVAGARLALGGVGGKRPVTARTNPQGEFTFDGIAPGSYELRVEHPGFKVYRTELNVGGRAHLPLRITLAIADLEQTLRVDSPDNLVSTETGGNLNVVTLDPRQLENLPVLGRDIAETLSPLLDPASVGSRGASVIVDGMESSEGRIPLSEIQQVSINKNPYSAEFARPGRGRVEIITKSGSSKYHGSLYLGFRDYHMDARNAFAVERPPEQYRQLEGNLSGPVRKGKDTTFSLTMSRSDDRLQAVIHALGPYGPVYGNAPKPQSSTYGSPQIMYRHGGNSLAVRYSVFDWSDRGEGVGGLSLPEVATDATSRYHQIYASYRALINPKLLNEFTVRVRTEQDAVRSRHAGIPGIVVLDSFLGGGGQTDVRSTDNRTELRDVFSWSHGRHSFKSGVHIPAVARIGSTDRSNVDGTFYFYSLADYAKALPFSYVRQSGDPRLVFWTREVGMFAQDEINLRPNLSLALGVRYDWQNHVPDHKAVVPRMSYAFAPDKSHKTVLRGGAGIFYDDMPVRAIGDVLRFDGSGLRQILVLNPGYPDPFAAGGAFGETPANLVRFGPGLRLPYVIQYSTGIERQVRKELTLSANYVGIRGDKMFRSRDVNAPLPPLYQGRPNPSLGTVRQIESSGGLRSNAVEVSLRGDLGHVFNGMAMYQWQHASNDTDGINAFPANNWDLRGEWSRASFDTRHFFYTYGTLTAGKLFSLGLIFSATSGKPYSLTTGRDDNHDGSANERPPGVSRNSLQGPGHTTLDLRWIRELRATRGKKDEGPSITLSIDGFNVLNRVNYSSFVGNINSPFFGQAVSAGAARRLQFSLSLRF